MFMFGMKVAKTPASPLQIQPATLWSDRHDLQLKNNVHKEGRTGAQSTLASLVGVWQDMFGSRYELTNGVLGEAPTLNVRTTRQDAHGEHSLFKETANLIRIEPLQSLDDHMKICWGKSFVLSGSCTPKDQTILEKFCWIAPTGKRHTFQWSRCD